MNDEKLTEIIKKKNFKNFWDCLDYLIIAGYSTLEAFGITLQEFGEPRIYSDVAFVRINLDEKIILIGNKPSRACMLTVGLIDESNINLSGLYTTYRKWMCEGKVFNQYLEIEDTCKKIMIRGLSPFLIDYLYDVSKSHFGCEIFNIPTEEKGLSQLAHAYDRPMNTGPFELPIPHITDIGENLAAELQRRILNRR